MGNLITNYQIALTSTKSAVIPFGCTHAFILGYPDGRRQCLTCDTPLTPEPPP